MAYYDEYPTHYDFSAEKMKSIITPYEMMIHEHRRYVREGDMIKAREVLTAMETYRLALQNFDCYIAYDWPGHRGEVFLATYEDGLMYEDYRYQCMD